MIYQSVGRLVSQTRTDRHINDKKKVILENVSTRLFRKLIEFIIYQFVAKQDCLCVHIFTQEKLRMSISFVNKRMLYCLTNAAARIGWTSTLLFGSLVIFSERRSK